MDPITTGHNRAEAERSLEIATKLLAARDLVGSKRFAELALDADPKLPDDRADQILAVADVLLASQKRVNNHLDWYSILQIPRPDPNSNPANFYYLLKCHYRRLSLLLHPDRNRSPGSDSAFKLILDAYNVLSDTTKRSLFDAELKISENLSSSSAAAAAAAATTGEQQNEPSFWTLCPSCCHVHQYARAYLNMSLRCQTCRRAFSAAELQAKPSIVPGTDMYYATWGCFPLGFSNPGSTDWKPFQSVYPTSGNGGGDGGKPHQNQGPADGPTVGDGGGGRGPAVPAARNKKKTARKKVVASGIKNRIFGWGDNQESVGYPEDDVHGDELAQRAEEARGININEAAKGIGEEDIEMIIDLDATDDMLGNLPFLKDEAINIQISQVRSGGF